MTYPKPLSQKSLDRMYAQAGIDAEMSEYLHKLFASCANLYGAIYIRDVWEFFHNTEGFPQKLRRKDLIAFSAIARREAQPYQIYELDEMYSGEKRRELYRIIIHQDLILYGPNRFYRVYYVLDEAFKRPPYIPADIFKFAEPFRSVQEEALERFLGRLRVTRDEYVMPSGRVLPCVHKGQRLKDFSFLSYDDEFAFEHFKNKPQQLESLRRETAGNAAEKLVRKFVLQEKIGRLSTAKLVEYMLDELDEMGVDINDYQLERLMPHINDLHNSLNMWLLCGWSPNELAQKTSFSGTPMLTFGSGMQKAFADGTLDREQIVNEARKHGFIVEDDN